MAQRTWSVPDASTDAVQAARAHEKALGAARLEAKEAREAHGALEKECAAKDEIERVTSAAAEHDPATAAELQLLRESVEEVARCNAVADARCCGRGRARGRFGHHGGERVASCADAGGGHAAVTAEVQQCQASHASQLDELGERFEACLAANRLLDEQLCSLRLKAQAQVTELLQLRAVRIVKITAVSTFWSAKTRDF
mgnify:CR=1 FL=1